MSCRGLGLSDTVVVGSQAGESQAGSLQALVHGEVGLQQMKPPDTQQKILER